MQRREIVCVCVCVLCNHPTHFSQVPCDNDRSVNLGLLPWSVTQKRAPIIFREEEGWGGGKQRCKLIRSHSLSVRLCDLSNPTVHSKVVVVQYNSTFFTISSLKRKSML